MLNQDFFINNRQNLISKLPKNSIIIIAANGLLQKTADNNYPFVQDSNFYYLTGLNVPNSFIILDTVNTKEYFCYNKKSKIEILFDGDYNYDLITKTSGINNFINTDQAYKWLKANSKDKQVYFNLNKPQLHIFNNPHNALVHKKLMLRGIKSTTINPTLANMRCIKQKNELTIIKKAISHTKKAIELATVDLHSINSESQIASIINTYFASNGLNHAYEPMVAAGISTTTAHYSANNKSFGSNHYLLLDVGAELNHYCSDISRTFINNKNNYLNSLIIELTDIQKQLIDFVKPGILFKDIQLKAVDLIGDLLISNNLIIDKKDTTKYFTYAIGHFLGLDVHDVGDYTKPLLPNMVITIEPGIHIPNKNIGIRIEDDILITNDGARVL